MSSGPARVTVLMLFGKLDKEVLGPYGNKRNNIFQNKSITCMVAHKPTLPAVAWYALIDGPFAPSPARHTLTLGKLFKPSGPQISHKIGMRTASSWRADCSMEHRYLPGDTDKNRHSYICVWGLCYIHLGIYVYLDMHTHTSYKSNWK